MACAACRAFNTAAEGLDVAACCAACVQMECTKQGYSANYYVADELPGSALWA